MNKRHQPGSIVSCICGQQFRAKPELAGKRVNCPVCGEPMDIPGTGDAAGLGTVLDDGFWSEGASKVNVVPTSEAFGKSLPSVRYASNMAKRKMPSWILPAGLVVVGIVLAASLVVVIMAFVSGFSSARKSASDGAVGDWKTFRHPSGGFAIAMPGHVDTSDEDTPDAAGFCSRKMDAFSKSSSGTMCGVTLYAGVAASQSGVPRFRQYGDRLYGDRMGVKGTDVVVAGHPGIEYAGTFPEDGKRKWIQARVFAVDDRLYELCLENGSGDAMPAEQADVFFGSFEVRDVERR